MRLGFNLWVLTSIVLEEFDYNHSFWSRQLSFLAYRPENKEISEAKFRSGNFSCEQKTKVHHQHHAGFGNGGELQRLRQEVETLRQRCKVLFRDPIDDFCPFSDVSEPLERIVTRFVLVSAM